MDLKRARRVLLGTTVLAATVCGLLAACTPSGKVGAPVPAEVIPDGLKDCQFYILENSGGSRFHIVRCPNSSTSLTMPGKHPENTATIDSGAPATPNIPLDARGEHDRQVDALLKKIDDEIARLEAKKKELR